MPISKKRAAEIEAIRDDDIDKSDIPEMDESFSETAKLVMPTCANKTVLSMRVDEDVLKWFKAQVKGHLSQMNAVLCAYILSHKPE